MYPTSNMASGKTEGSIVRICKACKSAKSNTYNKIKRERYTQAKNIEYTHLAIRFNEHIESIQQSNPKLMTEYQWYEKLKKYSGCATCNEKHVEIRALLVRPKLGGRYTDNNVVPLCDSCYKLLSMHDNPLIAMNPKFNSKATQSNYNKLIKAMKELSGGK